MSRYWRLVPDPDEAVGPIAREAIEMEERGGVFHAVPSPDPSPFYGIDRTSHPMIIIDEAQAWSDIHAEMAAAIRRTAAQLSADLFYVSPANREYSLYLKNRARAARKERNRRTRRAGRKVRR